MSFWGRALRLFGLGGVQIRAGMQSSVPLSYAQASAAPVTFETAMTVSAFWASARLLSEAVGALPLMCYRADGDASRPEPNYDLWRLLNFQPNRYQTRIEFFETLMLNLCTTGNSYHAIQFGADGRIVSLMPLMSAQVEVDLLPDGTVTYRHYGPNGEVRVFAEASIWHIRLFGNGLIGLSPLGHARQSLGIAIAADNRLGKLAANGGKTSGVLMVDRVLTPEQRTQVRNEFHRLTAGNDDQLLVLEAAMKYQQTSLGPAEVQLLESRKFQVEDIARFMGVPSVLINDTSGSTTWGSGIEQLVSGFYKLNLRPYLERIEASIQRHLMPPADWGTYSVEFDFDALLRGDLASRMEAYQKAINAGHMTPNETRKPEGLRPLAGGDRLLVNGTMVPVDQVQARRVPGDPA